MAASESSGKLTAALVLGLIGGIIGIFAAMIAVFFGGLGAALEVDGGETVAGLGFLSIFLAVMGIVGGALSRGKPTAAGVLQLIAGIGGFIAISAAWAISGPLLIVGGILALLGRPKDAPAAATA